MWYLQLVVDLCDRGWYTEICCCPMQTGWKNKNPITVNSVTLFIVIVRSSMLATILLGHLSFGLWLHEPMWRTLPCFSFASFGALPKTGSANSDFTDDVCCTNEWHRQMATEKMIAKYRTMVARAEQVKGFAGGRVKSAPDQRLDCNQLQLLRPQRGLVFVLDFFAIAFRIWFL